MTVYLSQRAAARRVQRDVRTVRRWERSGLAYQVDELGRHVYDEEVLLAFWRARLMADPAQRYRVRSARRARGLDT